MKTSLASVLLPIPTPDGLFHATYSASGLAGLYFPGTPLPSATLEPSPAHHHWHKRTAEGVLRVLAGKAARALPPLDLAGHTEFHRSVWELLLRIPAGQTRSYGELAIELGRPGGARAVGQACGRNPIPLLIPCHRVLAASRRIGGFSGGIDWKVTLLRREGILL